MPKVLRNYQREDFSALLNELKSSVDDDIMPANLQEKRETENIPCVISKKEQQRRLRASYMANRRLRYVRNKLTGMVHDKACPLVKHIPYADFEMLEDLTSAASICPKCRRAAFLRRGIGEEEGKIHAYVNFCTRCAISTGSLYYLMVRHNAHLHLDDVNTLTIKVNEDTWQLCLTESGVLCLKHNNYLVLEDGTRYIYKDFHIQKLFDKKIPRSDAAKFALTILCNYSWEEHLKLRECAAQTDKNTQLQTVPKETEEIGNRTTRLKRAWKKFLSVWSRFFHKNAADS